MEICASQSQNALLKNAALPLYFRGHYPFPADDYALRWSP